VHFASLTCTASRACRYCSANTWARGCPRLLGVLQCSVNKALQIPNTQQPLSNDPILFLALLLLLLLLLLLPVYRPLLRAIPSLLLLLLLQQVLLRHSCIPASVWHRHHNISPSSQLLVPEQGRPSTSHVRAPEVTRAVHLYSQLHP
jgi:hypothetical protein